jgi:transposase-like protein
MVILYATCCTNEMNFLYSICVIGFYFVRVCIELIRVCVCMYVMFLEMNRSWMYGDRRERDFQEGLREFCIAAVEHQRLSREPMIFCPCRDCGNVKRWTDKERVVAL